MPLDDDHQDNSLKSSNADATNGITFDHGGKKYTVAIEAALRSGLKGHSDRVQLPDGTLVMLHPHIHEDNANNAESIMDKGGKIWQIER